MTGFVPVDLADFHNHLLPGVDDGARTLAESIAHLRTLRSEGVTRLAVSPHLSGRLVHEAGAFHERLALLEAAFEALRASCAGRDDVPDLIFGQEVLLPDAEMAALVCSEPRVGIRGTSYVLIEFGFDLPEQPLAIVRAVLAAGRQPIVGHPERYRRNGEIVGIEEIRSWKREGAILQINGGSVLGDYGEAIEGLAWQLLAEGLADVIALDHHGDSRPVSPGQVAQTLAARGAIEQARLLLSENPQRILSGRPTVSVPPWREGAA
jgi:protein-tyrosine phosphatase